MGSTSSSDEPRKVKVSVANIVVTYKTVEIETVCPNCKADLTVDGAIKAWEYVDEGVRGRLHLNPLPSPHLQGPKEENFLVRDVEMKLKDGEVEEETFLMSGSTDRSHGDNFICYVAYWCLECDEPFLEGDYEAIHV